MGGFGLVTLVVSLALLSRKLGGSGQSFLSLKKFPDIIPASGHGVLLQTGASFSGGGLLSGVGALETVTGGHTAA